MKRELEKITGPMTEETLRVQQNLKKAMAKSIRRKRKIYWQVPLVASLFVIIVGAFIYSAQTPNHIENPATDLTTELFNEELFTWHTNMNIYTQSEFVYRDDAKYWAYEKLLADQAWQAYAKEKGYTVQQEAINQQYEKLKEEWATKSNKIVYTVLEQQTNITVQQFERYLMNVAENRALQETVVSSEPKVMKSQQVLNDFENELIEHYTKKNKQQIERFKTTYQIKEYNSRQYTPLAELPEQYAFLVGIELAMNAQGNYIFIDGRQGQQYLDENYSDVIYLTAPDNVYRFAFGLFSYNQYKENAQKLANEEGPNQQRAEEFLLLCELLEETYKDSYTF